MKTTNYNTVEQLNKLLSDYQIHYQNLRGLHWNIKGKMFFTLHSKFEEYYNEASDIIDEIAERILMLGGQPLHTFDDYIKTASLKKLVNVSDGNKAVDHVLENNQTILKSLKDVFSIANENDDEGTSSLISEWIGQTEKRIWMLESFLS